MATPRINVMTRVTVISHVLEVVEVEGYFLIGNEKPFPRAVVFLH